MILDFSEALQITTFNMMKAPFTNKLIAESSPYLLQHAHNPVHWYPWGQEALERARNENKLLLISIGYAACHWCHVMEKESFEDEAVADVMNRSFINIKVDREERPDIDTIYMSAVQLMTGGGGWPLNVAALPDGRPVWGGTYFRKDQWISILDQLATLHTTQPEKLQDYAQQLREGLININTIVPPNDTVRPTSEDLNNAIEKWTPYFDAEYGGMQRAPKFMMPVNLEFLMHYGVQTQHEAVLQHVDTTLTKMAYGGVYDHIGGGFSRYSVDEKWHVPHFEKMLYDNAQLVSLYSHAFQRTQNTLYKSVVEETLAFTERELMNPEGAFFSSLDADSINNAGAWEEGAFYVWTKDELQQLLKDDFPIFADHYNINAFGHWEEGNHVLIRSASEDAIAAGHQLSPAELKTIIDRCKETLFNVRSQRNRPRLDDKILTSWNALMLNGYSNAYKAFGDEHYRSSALKNAEFILKHQHTEDGGLYHNHKNGQSTVNGFLEDYATVCDAFIGLYEITGDETWLNHTRQLVNYCYDNFYDEKSGFFFFTSIKDAVVVTRTLEKTDNVIPASNSILAKVLFKLSHYFGNSSYLDTAEHMLSHLKSDILKYPYSHANWLDLALYTSGNFYEIAITGDNAQTMLRELTTRYLPHTIIAASVSDSKLPLLQHRNVPGKTLIYVCRNNHCELPSETVAEALQQLG